MKATRLCILFLATFWTSLATASPFCQNVAEAMEDLAAGRPAKALPGAGRCVQQTGPVSLVCQRAFVLGAEDATEAYELLGAKIETCISSVKTVEEDQPVNHPDTSRSQIYWLESGSLRIAFKDKSALGKTFVFLQITPGVP